MVQATLPSPPTSPSHLVLTANVLKPIRDTQRSDINRLSRLAPNFF